MNNIGFIYLYRNMRGHWLWRDPKKFLRWTDLLMEAAWEPASTVFGNSRVLLERGQLVTSVRTLMHRWGTNSRYVSDFLDLLEAEKMIVTETTKAYTLITIVGYDEQQRGQGNGYNEETPPPANDTQHLRLRQGQREESQSKEDNNINNNNSSLSIEEQNLKFVELIKTNNGLMEEAMLGLRREKSVVLELLELFMHDINFKSMSHPDCNAFRSHFINWSREYLRKEQAYANRKPKPGGGGSSQDRYENRRGTDAKDHTAEDYTGTF